MESSLNNHFIDLKGDVGFFLGYGRGPDNGDTEWDDYQTRTIERIIKGGMRKFYYAGPQWSFLKPVASITLAEGESTVDLPDDFGSVEGSATVSADDTILFPLPFGLIGTVYQNQANFPDVTGRPQYICEEPLKGMAPGRSPGKRLRVFPIADQDYTFQFQYNLNPNYLTGQYPYAYGGPQHAETLLQACKATAEIDLDNVREGPHFMEFMRLLSMSVQVDGRNKPQHLGMNIDRSDWTSRRYRGRDFVMDQTVTIGGVVPS